MKRFVLTPEAVRDLDQIKQHFRLQAVPTSAFRVMRELQKNMILLGSEPGVGHLREDLTVKPLKFWPVFSYLIVYDPLTKRVKIIRVLHGMRNIAPLLH